MEMDATYGNNFLNIMEMNVTSENDFRIEWKWFWNGNEMRMVLNGMKWLKYGYDFEMKWNFLRMEWKWMSHMKMVRINRMK